MIDISAFINDPELRPALIGLIGVGVGGLMTVTGQSVSRRAERLHKMKEEVAHVIGLSHMIRSLQVAFHENDGAPEDVKDSHLQQLNQDRPEMFKRCQVLLITAPKSVAWASKELAESIITLDEYAHPATGTGRQERFKNVLYYGKSVSQAEAVLGNVARSPWWCRWPQLWLGHRRASKLDARSPVADD